MELWIRSQKNEKLRPMLLKANEFEIGDYDEDMNCIVVNNLYCVGVYKTKERALEVLDEIQNKIKTLLYLKPKTNLDLKHITDAKRYFEKLNSINFITTDTGFEIEPITTNVVIYEMPKE